MLVAVAGDMHLPWPSKRALALFFKRLKYRKHTTVVQVGDLYDCYSWGRFPRSHCVLTPAEEIKRARKMAEEFWAEVRRIVPKADCHQLLGNHDSRPAKKLISQIPEYEPFADSFASWWQFPGVHTQPSEREELLLGGTCFMHGYRGHGDHVRHNLMNTWVGHLHRGGVVYMRHGKKTIWEANAGLMGDPDARALSYTLQKKVATYTLGMGEQDDEGPRFIAV